jgi:hypothetical protein
MYSNDAVGLQQFSDDEGDVNELLAPLPDEPEVAEDDDDVKPEDMTWSVPPEPISCNASELILPKEELPSKVSSPKPHPLSISFGLPLPSEQADNGLGSALQELEDDLAGTVDVADPLGQTDLVNLGLLQLGLDGAAFKAAGDLTQLQSVDNILGTDIVLDAMMSDDLFAIGCEFISKVSMARPCFHAPSIIREGSHCCPFFLIRVCVSLFFNGTCADFQSFVSLVPTQDTSTLSPLHAAVPQAHAPFGTLSQQIVVATPSLALCPGLQRIRLCSCSSISCASEFDAGSAFSGDGYGEVMAGNTPHWLAQIFNSEVKACIKQPSPKRPSCVGFYVALSLGSHPYHIVAC